MAHLFYPGDLVCREDGICGRVVACNAETALVHWGQLYELVAVAQLELADEFAAHQLLCSLGHEPADS